MKKFMCWWDASYRPMEVRLYDSHHFCQAMGYDAEDISGVMKLEPGETWWPSDDDPRHGITHIVTRVE